MPTSCAFRGCGLNSSMGKTMFYFPRDVKRDMSKQIKGSKPKLTAKEKEKLKKEYLESQKQVYTIALPTIAVLLVFIAAYVYIKTRPISYDV